MNTGVLYQQHGECGQSRCQRALFRLYSDRERLDLSVMFHYCGTRIVSSARTVICSVLLATDQHFRMEELAISTSADLIDWLLLVSILPTWHRNQFWLVI